MRPNARRAKILGVQKMLADAEDRSLALLAQNANIFSWERQEGFGWMSQYGFLRQTHFSEVVLPLCFILLKLILRSC